MDGLGQTFCLLQHTPLSALVNSQFYFARQLDKNPASGLCRQTRDMGADNPENGGALESGTSVDQGGQSVRVFAIPVLPLSCPRTRGCGHPAEAVPGCSECRRTWPGETAERLADRGGVDLLGPRERRQSGAPQVQPHGDANTKNVIRRRGARGLLEKKRTKATRVCASGWGTRLERFADNVNAGFKGSRRVNVAEPSGTGCSGLSSGRTPAVVEPGRSCVRAAQAQRREPS